MWPLGSPKTQKHFFYPKSAIKNGLGSLYARAKNFLINVSIPTIISSRIHVGLSGTNK